MRTTFAVAGLAALFVAPVVYAQTAIERAPKTGLRAAPDDPPFHVKDSHGEVIVRQGHNLTVEPGLNDLHPPKTMTCRSASGCELTFSVMINITASTEAPFQICSAVDGVPAKPQCFDQGAFTATNLQSLKVAQGEHVVQTQFLDQGHEGVIGEWQIIYTLYEKSRH